MKYIIFREQVAECFGIGSQDVCIVGSAKLGFSPSVHQFGRPFSDTSDVDVVVISEPLFYRGSRVLFETLDQLCIQRTNALYELRFTGIPRISFRMKFLRSNPLSREHLLIPMLLLCPPVGVASGSTWVS